MKVCLERKDIDVNNCYRVNNYRQASPLQHAFRIPEPHNYRHVQEHPLPEADLLAIAGMLLARRANPNTPFGSRCTVPLHYARTPAVAKFLLEHRAEVDALDIDNKTPLMYAAEVAYAFQPHGKELIEVLLENGANNELKSLQGKTAAGYAWMAVPFQLQAGAEPHICEFIRDYMPPALCKALADNLSVFSFDLVELVASYIGSGFARFRGGLFRLSHDTQPALTVTETASTTSASAPAASPSAVLAVQSAAASSAVSHTASRPAPASAPASGGVVAECTVCIVC